VAEGVATISPVFKSWWSGFSAFLPCLGFEGFDPEADGFLDEFAA
jgi:hypothetical protein